MTHVYVVDPEPVLHIWTEISVPKSEEEYLRTWDQIPKELGSFAMTEEELRARGEPGLKALALWSSKDDSLRDDAYESRWSGFLADDVRRAAINNDCEVAHGIIARGLDPTECDEFVNSHFCSDHSSVPLVIQQALARGVSRWFVMSDGRIAMETSTPGILGDRDLRPAGLLAADVVASPDLDSQIRAAWESLPDRRYLVMCASAGDHLQHEHFVDVVTDTEGVATALRLARGGGTIRTRTEMLEDPKYPNAWATELERWERHDDTIAARFNAGYGADVYHYRRTLEGADASA